MRSRLMVLLLICSLLFISCKSGGTESGGIVTPENEILPIEGRWVITDYFGEGYSNRIVENFVLSIGDICLFHHDGIVLGNRYTLNPKFRIKTVPTKTFLLKKYRTNATKSILNEERVEVINIISEDENFAEFLKIDDRTCLLAVDQGFYLLEQERKQVSLQEVVRFIEAEENINRDVISKKNKITQSGLLLGVKVSADKDDDSPHYHTLFLAFQDGNVVGCYNLNSLIFPRKNGFWYLNYDIMPNDNITYQIGPLKKKEQADTQKESLLNISNGGFSIQFNVGELLFVGNDFISLEHDDGDGARQLSIYAIDNLNGKNALRLSDLIPDGKTRFLQSESAAIGKDMVPLGQDDQIALMRDKGYWNLTGRRLVNASEQFPSYIDFPINVAVPRDMVKYDRNILPWSEIQLILPESRDAFFSPNKENLVALSDKELLIYRTNSHKIYKGSIYSLPLEGVSSVVMVEWATDEHVDRWVSELIAQGATNMMEVR